MIHRFDGYVDAAANTLAGTTWLSPNRVRPASDLASVFIGPNETVESKQVRKAFRITGYYSDEQKRLFQF